MIIDCHTHRYPEEIFSNVNAWANTMREFYWKKLVLGSRGKKSIQGWATREKLLQDMDYAGVNKVVMLGWYWEHQATCKWHNDWHTKWLKKDLKHLIAFAAVQPRDGRGALEDLKRAVDNGAKGIGEIFPEAQGFKMNNKVWLKIIEFAIENNLPINMHVTEPVGHDYPGKLYQPLSDYQWLASEYPDLKLILAHWGGLLPFYELNPEIKETFKNVYYDTAASPLLYDSKVFKAVIDVVGAKKILYGSDYPLRVYPKKQKEPNFKDFINEINALELNKDTNRAIFSSNFSNLVSI